MQMQSFTTLPPCHTSLFCFPTKHCCCLVKINCRWRKNIKIALSASTLQVPWATTIVATVAANGSKEVSLIVCKINTMLVRAAPVRSSCPPWGRPVAGRVMGSPRTKEKHFSNVLPFSLGFYFELPGLVAGLPIKWCNNYKESTYKLYTFRVTMWDKFLKAKRTL